MHAAVTFLMDCLLNFFTGYVLFETDKIELQHRKIIVRYLKTWSALLRSALNRLCIGIADGVTSAPAGVLACQHFL